MAQNKSHAVMAQRTEAKDSLDDFPTPPWATHAFLRAAQPHLSGQSVWEPACNRLYMARVLQEYFECVIASDIADYGGTQLIDFLACDYGQPIAEWIITNPPFKAFEAFYHKARAHASKGVALLARSGNITESVGRYERMYADNPPTYIYQYVERVAMVKGRYDPDATTATAYCWLVWHLDREPSETVFRWIPPGRKSFERDGDDI